MPPQLGEWATNTILCTGAGALYGGARGWRAITADPPPPPPTGVPPGVAARAIAEEKTRRLARLGNECVRGAARFGGLAGLFWGLTLGAEVYRGEPALLADTASAAAAVGALYGALLPGPPHLRVRSAALGAGLGAAVAVPAALAQSALAGLLPESERQRVRMISGRTAAAATSTTVDADDGGQPRRRRTASDVLAVVAALERDVAESQRQRAQKKST